MKYENSCFWTQFITARNSSCGKVMFSQVCVKNSVHGGGVYPSIPLGEHPPTGKTPPTTTAYCQQAGGTHPTGMHSCLV